MAELPSEQEASDRPRWRAQFTLRTLLMTVNAVAISLAVFVCLWKDAGLKGDGPLLIALVIPAVAVFLLPLGSVRRKLRVTVVATLMSVGIAWSVMFPKDPDFFCPGMFASIATGVGLFGAALLLIALWRKPVWLGVLAVVLLWSLLWGLVHINWLHYTGKLAPYLVKQNAPLSSPQQMAGPAASNPGAEGATTTPAASWLVGLAALGHTL